MVVSGIPGLDGTYTFSVDKGDKPEDVCVDGCVYTRSSSDHPGAEYCFKNMQSDGSVKCQVGCFRYWGSGCVGVELVFALVYYPICMNE